MKTTVFYHSADFDGLFCREIARKFLPGAELIGWNFGDAPLFSPEGQIYVMDLPIDRLFGIAAYDLEKWVARDRCIWIDHHKSSIESHPATIPGYRIDGVAACRLAWQWFLQVTGQLHNPYPCAEFPTDFDAPLPFKEQFIERDVSEPLAVRLAGEYDVWDHRGDGDVEFQFGLDAQRELDWQQLFMCAHLVGGALIKTDYVQSIIKDGEAAMRCYAKRDADVMRTRSFIVEWKGLKFLALNTARCNSNTFAARDVPETGHDALMAMTFTGKGWLVSLYHAAHRSDIDLSLIAKQYGGGGHRGACGFQTDKLPFL